MAAYDYRMALVRGLVAPQKELQAEVRDLAGQSFKSEDWWNKQLDRQINEGMQQFETGTEYKTKSGDYVLGKRTTRVRSTPFGVGSNSYTTYDAPQDAVITGYTGGGFGLYNTSRAKYDTRSVQVVGPDRKDLTAGQLKTIENQAKATSARVKRDAAKANKAGERKLRGSGGLMGRVKGNEKGLSAQLPELGSTGLGIEKVLL